MLPFTAHCPPLPTCPLSPLSPPPPTCSCSTAFSGVIAMAVFTSVHDNLQDATNPAYDVTYGAGFGLVTAAWALALIASWLDLFA